MKNSLSLLLYNKYHLFSILFDKLNFFISNINIINKIKVYFTLENKSENRILFLLKLMLFKKFLNMDFHFLFNSKILKDKIIKVGCSSKLKWKQVFRYIVLFFYYSISKLLWVQNVNNAEYLYDKLVSLFPLKFFQLARFLFLDYFTIMDDYNIYYNYFESMSYTVKLKVYSSFKYNVLNSILLRILSINVL